MRHLKEFNKFIILESSIDKLTKMINLMKKHGCVEDFGTGIDFDSIGSVVGKINGKDISKISTSTIYLEDDSELPISKLSDKIIDKIINLIKDFPN